MSRPLNLTQDPIIVALRDFAGTTVELARRFHEVRAAALTRGDHSAVRQCDEGLAQVQNIARRFAADCGALPAVTP